ncbi:uncharacterized protein LOC127877081 isoform X2 [Dreissena polymorpha]|uniref:uncharacterized protein LOC127877081 isoform X2 n=1 Tax=Dreissena polymorpha TaxID=45954 RepID=UPI002264B17D|nr:uncharacterized protein LOC127877081 isoform X2 [Dreissena polymorpha]
MDSKIQADLEVIAAGTRGILTSLEHIEAHGGHVCRNHDVLSEIEHDLRVLNERVTSAEESIKRQPNMAQLKHRFDEIQEQMDEMQRVFSNVHTGTSAKSERMDSYHLPRSSRGISLPQTALNNRNENEVQKYSTGTVQTNVDSQSSDRHLSTLDRVRFTHKPDSTGPNLQPTQDNTSDESDTEHSDQELVQHTPPEQTRVRNQPQLGVARQGFQQQASETLMDTEAWVALANRELVDARLRTQPLRAFHTVLLLDISESMASGNAWTQAKQFVNDFMEGLQEHDPLYQPTGFNEHVAIATFGHKTQLDVLMTTDFKAVRDKIDNMMLGGPSPLYGGLMLAAAGALSAQNEAQLINGYVMHNKIIVVTDGRPTETSKTIGPDVADQRTRDQTTVDIIRAMNIIDSKQVSILYVGVGDYDKEFLEILTADSPSSTVFTYKDGRRLSRRNYLCIKVSLMELTLAQLGHGLGTDTLMITAQDIDDLRSIYMTSLNYHERMERDKSQSRVDTYHESSNPQLPMIGTRVVRGVDWNHGDQDKNGPGTIVGHAVDDAVVWVHWDGSTELHWYPYGDRGFAVLISDDERQLRPGEILAVGCHVKPISYRSKCKNRWRACLEPWSCHSSKSTKGTRAMEQWKKRGLYLRHW